ncbi:ABC transporter ATP-binding protein, partial [Lactobacillus sp. XV13L]|nr:ABC transporter ATP-binding protein [Lactobacillus sp. XV13L]
MTIKSFFKTLPKLLLAGILVTTVIASFDGVILSYVISNVTRFNHNSTVAQVVTYVAASMLIWGLIYFAMALKQVLINQAVKLLNIKIKNSFVYDQVTKPDFNAESSDSVSKIFNDFKLVETNYFETFFELCGSLLMGIVSGCYILYLNLPIGILFILFSLVPMISSKLFGRVLTASSTTWQKDSGTYLGKVTDLFKGIQTIKTYLAERAMFRDTENYLKQTEDSYKKMNDYQAWAIFVSAILSAFSFLLPLGAG